MIEGLKLKRGLELTWENHTDRMGRVSEIFGHGKRLNIYWTHLPICWNSNSYPVPPPQKKNKKQSHFKQKHMRRKRIEMHLVKIKNLSTSMACHLATSPMPVLVITNKYVEWGGSFFGGAWTKSGGVEGEMRAGLLSVNLGRYFWTKRSWNIWHSSISYICFWKNMRLRYRRKIIKVSWGDPGRNGGFWGSFLLHWNFNLP